MTDRMRFLVGAICASVVFSPALAQQAAGPLYPIAGTLTDSVTGDPIFGATLTLATERPRSVIQTTVSDARGHFSLGPVPASKYSLTAYRRGYLAAAFDEHEQYSSAIVTGAGQDTTHIPFHLDPECQMHGVITDDAGDPVANATVVLLRRTNTGGFGDRVIHVTPTQTDDTGEFLLWSLHPGDYYVSVTGSPWYALHPTAEEETTVSNDQQRASVYSLDVAYPVTWYDGSADESAAAAIHLAPGDTGEANVTLHAIPALHLMVHLPADAGQVRFAQLQRSLMGQSGLAPDLIARPGPLGSDTLEFTGVTPGHYTASWGEPAHLSDIDTTESQEISLAAGTATANTTLQFKMADGSALPKNLRVLLANEKTTGRVFDTTLQGTDTAQFSSVPPGRWIIDASTTDVSYGVVSIQTGSSAPKPDTRLDVAGQRANATVLIAEGKTRIDGFAFQDGKGKPGVMILLVPKDFDAHKPWLRRDQSDSDGSFSLPFVLPGNYTVLAIENGWGLEYFNSSAIARYLPHGTPVTVTAGAGPVFQLSTPVAVQTR
jgi:hypothetical protein